MEHARIYAMPFASVYPHYVTKVEKKGRTRAELDEVIRWLTGYSPKGLAQVLERRTDFATFFEAAPRMNPNAPRITGTICGVRIAEIEEPLMRQIRWLDKLVDELAKGRPMEKVLRSAEGETVAKPMAKAKPAPKKAAKAKPKAAPTRTARRAGRAQG